MIRKRRVMRHPVIPSNRLFHLHKWLIIQRQRIHKDLLSNKMSSSISLQLDSKCNQSQTPQLLRSLELIFRGHTTTSAKDFLMVPTSRTGFRIGTSHQHPARITSIRMVPPQHLRSHHRIRDRCLDPHRLPKHHSLLRPENFRLLQLTSKCFHRK